MPMQIEEDQREGLCIGNLGSTRNQEPSRLHGHDAPDWELDDPYLLGWKQLRPERDEFMQRREDVGLNRPEGSSTQAPFPPGHRSGFLDPGTQKPQGTITRLGAVQIRMIRRQTARSTIIFLISAMASAGFRPLGQVLAQFMMV